MDRNHFTPNFDHSVLNLKNSMPLNCSSFNSQKTQLELNNTELEKQFRPINFLRDLNTHSLKKSNCSNTQMEIKPTIASPNEGSSVSEQIPVGETEDKSPSNNFISRKRKSISKGKPQKVIVNDQVDRDSKRCEKKVIGNDEKNNEKQDAKTPEPPKDYIHVRARRGQATDSHSLAERVRREKIGERMRLLQDLVPGCNKVTGKALMLDEIINYVQSLQCQVEFLSMKLASVDELDFNMDSVLSKDVINSTYQLESSSLFAQQKQEMHQAETELSTHCSLDPSDNTLFRDISLQFPFVDNFGQCFPQFSGSYEDDLQSVVQMGFGFDSQNFPGSSDTTHMSIEL